MIGGDVVVVEEEEEEFVGSSSSSSRILFRPPHRLPRSYAVLLALYISLSVATMTLIGRRFEGSGGHFDDDELVVVPVAVAQGGQPLLHNMSDKELFRKAAGAGANWQQVRVSGGSLVPKIAFMFLTRGGPMPVPLAPLWESFFSGHQGLYSIYVHTSSSDRGWTIPANSVFHSRGIPSKAVHWGRMSVCDAEKRLLANAMVDDVSNQWFVLLSESCIPLYNFSVVYDYITKSKHSFVHAFPDEDLYLRLSHSDIIKIWKGFQWFVVEREVGLEMVLDRRYYRKFSRMCKAPCFPDEHYFQTMLSIEAGSRIANRSLTWVNWSRPGPHPIAYSRPADITMDLLLTTIRQNNSSSCTYNSNFTSTCHLFARKWIFLCPFQLRCIHACLKHIPNKSL